MKACVLGATGLVGSALCELMNDKEICHLAISSEKDLTKRDVASHLLKQLNEQGVTHIFHCADVNLEASLQNTYDISKTRRLHENVIDAWELYSDAMLINISTQWAYPQGLTSLRESDYYVGELQEFCRDYGQIKRDIDKRLDKSTKLSVTCVLGNVFGENDRSSRLINKLINHKMLGLTPTLRSVNSTRSYVYVHDVAKNIFLLSQHLHRDIINIGGNHNLSVEQIVRLLELNPEFLKDETLNSGDRILDTTKFDKQFVSHKTPIKDSLTQVINAKIQFLNAQQRQTR